MFSVDERFSEAAKRQTTWKEDKAYCLLGTFDIYLPPIYGEGDNAFNKLKAEIAKASTGKAFTLLSLLFHTCWAFIGTERWLAMQD
jgi:hypothetical protein